jgi:ribosomal protein L11 methyltransferase
MKPKPLWKISAVTTPDAEDAVAEMLGSALKLPASSFLDLKTGVSTVSVICERKPEHSIRKFIAAGLARIQNCGLATGPGKISIARIRREDWAESWKRHFKPLEIKIRMDESCTSLAGTTMGTRGTHPPGKSLLIKPSWNKRRPRKNQALVILDPGLSFGTGHHPTTAFCLREIVRSAGGSPSCCKPKDPRTSRPRSSFLDIGSGSGILAIAAAKLGFSPVEAFDFDPESVKIARMNARVNGVAGKVRVRRGDAARLPLRPARRYDLICANLISTLLIAVRRRIAAQLSRGGTLVLAGILKSEFAAVEKSFAEIGLKPVSGRTEREWRSGSFRFAGLF